MAHPYHVLLHQHMGIDSFALDGDETVVPEEWHERARQREARPTTSPSH